MMKTVCSILLALLGIVSAMAEQTWVSLSLVGELKGQKRQVKLSGVKGELKALDLEIRGEGADAFVVTDKNKEPNGALLLDIAFRPIVPRGYFSAELVVKEGEAMRVIQLRGVAIKALEGKNEPPLQEVLDSFGTRIDAGGKKLSMSTEEETIGESVVATRFQPVQGSVVKMTPLARYSPPGVTPFGLIIEEGEQLRMEVLGELANTTEERPDAHQSVRPPLSDRKSVVTIAKPPEEFGLFLKAHKYTSLTFPGRSKGAKIKHTARIYPVKSFQGKAVKDAYIVGFEEASNGDYQDAVFLIEGVKAVK